MIAISGAGKADQITVYADSTQTTPLGMIGAPPPAGSASNDFSLWGVEYMLTGGDEMGCSSVGGDSLCFGDTIGTSDLGLSLLVDPVLSGPLVPNVALTLTFASGTTELDFGVAVGTLLDTSSCPTAREGYPGLMPGCPARVELFDSLGAALTAGSFQWTLPYGSLITEGEFSYSGPSIARALITFPDADSTDSEFAIDNLTYQSEVIQEAPESGTAILLGLALIVISLGVRVLRMRDGSYQCGRSHHDSRIWRAFPREPNLQS